MSQHAHLLVQLTRLLARQELAGAPLSIRLCTAYVRLARAERGAISLGALGDERSLLCATDESAARYEDAQDLAGEGPTLQALRTGTVASVDSDEAHVRTWPRLSGLSPEHPAHVHALPMRPDGLVVGVVTVHFEEAGMLDEEQESRTSSATPSVPRAWARRRTTTTAGACGPSVTGWPRPPARSWPS